MSSVPIAQLPVPPPQQWQTERKPCKVQAERRHAAIRYHSPLSNQSTHAPQDARKQDATTGQRGRCSEIYEKKFSIRAPAAGLFAVRERERQAGASTHDRALSFIV